MFKRQFLFFVTLASLMVGNVHADDDQERMINVVGNGEVLVAPNTVTLQIAVETQAPQANQAVQKNAQQMTQVVNALKDQLSKDDKLSTSRYNLNPVYQYDQAKQQSVLTAYQVTNYVVVTTKQLNELGKLLDSAAQAGANRVDSLQFSHDEMALYQQQALVNAVSDAKQTAEVLAKAANVQLGNIQKIQPQQQNVVPVTMLSMAKTGAHEATTPVEPGLLTINMAVNIVYEIE